MNGAALGGIILLLYAVLVFYITIAKPPKMWDMAKIKWYREKMGEKGTEIFFYIWGILAAGIGIWLMIK